MSARGARRGVSSETARYGPAVPSVGERLEKVVRRLALAKAAARPPEPDQEDELFPEGDLRAALRELLLETTDELYWLRLLPGRALRQPAPDDDEYEAAHGGRQRRRQAVRP